MGIAVVAVQNMDLPLNEDQEAIALRLVLPLGTYVLIGRTTITNADGGSPQNAVVRMTTMDGEFDLDVVQVRIPAMDGTNPGTQVVSLQAYLSVDANSPDRIVDLRMVTINGAARESKLYAIQVDNIQGG